MVFGAQNKSAEVTSTRTHSLSLKPNTKKKQHDYVTTGFRRVQRSFSIHQRPGGQSALLCPYFPCPTLRTLGKVRKVQKALSPQGFVRPLKPPTVKDRHNPSSAPTLRTQRKLRKVPKACPTRLCEALKTANCRRPPQFFPCPKVCRRRKRRDMPESLTQQRFVKPCG